MDKRGDGAMNIEVLSSRDAVAQRGAEMVCQCATEAVARDGEFNIALSGGTTPKHLYQLLAAAPLRSRLPWDKIRWFLGDERNVPLDHKDSNYHMACETLFNPANVDESNRFPLAHAGTAAPEQVASDYELDILQWVPRGGDQSLPQFDLVLLGVGTDGHTASLFPHTKALHSPEGKIVVANWVEKLQTWRYTLSPDVIRSAARIVVLVTGDDKAEALQHVLEGAQDIAMYPAQIVRDLAATTWLCDEAAAAKLKSR